MLPYVAHVLRERVPVWLALILLALTAAGALGVGHAVWRGGSTSADHRAVVVAQMPAVLPPTPAVVPAEVASIRGSGTPDLPMYQIYQAADGDTVDSVAARFGIAPEYIFANNDSLATQFLVPRQSLVIPVGNGILHEVRYGETLTDIATEYDVEPNAILSFPANHLTGPEDLTHTNIIFVPGAHIPAPAASTSPPAPAR